MSRNELELELRRGPEAPATARAAISRQLDGRLSDQQLFDLRVVVSTLVSNSVRNGDGPIAVSLSTGDGAVSGEVSDRGAGAESLRRLSGSLGRPGLGVLDAVTRDWGTGAQQVWFVV
jgi:anti-sigma regulatory factor (Ser/Thr protein kinase)